MTPFALRLLATVLPIAIAGVAAVLGARAHALRSGGPAEARLATARALLGTCTLALAWWTLLLANPNQDGARHANLIPFREIARSLTTIESGYGIVNFWGNIVVFAPIGALVVLSLRPGRRFAWLVAAGAGIGLSIVFEIGQYAIGRSADVDDVILNAVVVLLGALAVVVARRVVRQRGPSLPIT